MFTILRVRLLKEPVGVIVCGRGFVRRYFWPTGSSLGRLRKAFRLWPEFFAVIEVTLQGGYLERQMRASKFKKPLGLSTTNKVHAVEKDSS